MIAEVQGGQRILGADPGSGDSKHARNDNGRGFPPNHGPPRADCAILNSGVCSATSLMPSPLLASPCAPSAAIRTGVDLTSYADLAVRLVNSTNQGRDRGDGLATVESYRGLVADRPHLAGKVTGTDLEALRLLREELRQIFAAADRGEAGQVAERLNALLTRHPIHQQLDQPRWPAVAHPPGGERVGRRPARGGCHRRADRPGHRVRHRPVRDLRGGRTAGGSLSAPALPRKSGTAPRDARPRPKCGLCAPMGTAAIRAPGPPPRADGRPAVQAGRPETTARRSAGCQA